ncbi:MAG: radical SAM protein [Candidatus Woesearchaeota archaeon]
MIELISLYLKDDTGKKITTKTTTYPEIELIKGSLEDFFNELGINAEIYFDKNTIFLKDERELLKKFKELYESGKLYEMFNMKKIEEFERQILSEDNKEKLVELLLKAYIYAVCAFLLPDSIYKNIYLKFKNNNKENLFYEAILPEKENFFLRIAKSGLNVGFAKVFGKPINAQNITKQPKLNDLSYWKYDFLTELDKKNIHLLNTLQYLLDEKNNYLAIIEEKLKKISNFYSLNGKIKKLGKKRIIINQQSRFCFIDDLTYNYLKNNKRIYDYTLTRERLQEFEELHKLNLLKKNNLEHHIEETKKLIIKPKLIVINLTSYCNLRCTYCYNFNNLIKEHYEPNVERLEKIIEKIILDVNQRSYTFVFHGGEPLLYVKEIKELVNFINSLSKNLNFKPFFSIQTNGILIDESILEFIKENRISLSISVDGPPTINQISRNIKEDDAVKLDRILNKLKDNNIPFSILVTVNKNNITKLDEILKYFQKIKPSSVRFNTLIYSDFCKEIIPSTEEYIKFYISLFQRYIKGNYSFKLSNLIDMIESIAVINREKRKFICSNYPCGAGTRMLNVLGNGDVYACGELILNDIKIEYDECMNSQSLIDLIKKKFEKLLNLNFSKIPCKNCFYKNICTNDCIGRTYHMFNDFEKRSPYCKLNKKIIEFILKNWDNKVIQKYYNLIRR